MNNAGQLRWQASITGPSGGNIPNGPAVGPDGTVYVATGGSNGNTASDIDAFSPSGALESHYTADGMFETTPAVFALSDGNAVWTASGASDASPALADNGALYVSGFGALQAFHA